MCSTVRAGRIFVSRIIQEIKQFPNKGRRRLSKDTKKDIHWWDTFLEQFDGFTIIPDTDWSCPDEVFATDATLTMCGGWSYPEFFKKQFPKWITNSKENISINELELLAFIVAIKKWRKRVQNKNLLAYCDNKCTIEVVNLGKAKNSFAQKCLRELTYILATINAVVKVIYISSECNRIPDSLSRWTEGQVQHDRFEMLTKGINKKEIFVENKDFEFIHNW